MLKSFDVYDDKNQQQLHLLEQYFGLPEFVKSSAVEEKRPELALTAYADPVRQKYPCHTKTATWLAHAYFLLNRSNYSTKEASAIQGRLTKFANYWGMEGIINQLTECWSKVSEGNSKLADNDYALVVEHEGNKIRRMPLNNPMSVKASAEYLKQNRHKYPYEWRKTAALNLLSEGAFLDVETVEFLNKTAGFGIIDPKQAACALRQRAALIKNAESRNAINKTADELAASLPSTLITDRFLKATDQLDREYGLSLKYESGLTMPEDVVELTETKLAATISNHVQLTTGKVYSIEALSKLPLEKIADALGDDFSDEVRSEDGINIDLEKFARIAATLPRGDAELLEKAIGASTSADRRGL